MSEAMAAATQSRARGLARAEFAFVVLTLVLVSRGLEQLVAPPVSIVERVASGQFSLSARLMLVPAYLYAAHVFLRHPRAARRALGLAWPALALVGLCVVSTLWSIDPFGTLARSALLVAVTLYAVAVATRLSPVEIIAALAIAGIVLFAAELLAIGLAPRLALHHDAHYPAMRGLFTHKNVAGRTFAVGLAAGLHLLVSGPWKRLGALSAACAAAGAALSLSVTALVLCAAILATYGFLAIARRNISLGALIAFGAGMIALGILVLDQTGAALGALGRDPTLTTRTLIWDRLVATVAENRFWLGYGYEAFWSSPLGALGHWNPRHFVPGHAHNGLLQTWTGIGMAGLVLAVPMLLRLYAGALHAAVFGARPEARFCAAFLVYFLIQNISETSLLDNDGLIWPAFVMVMVMLRARRPGPQ